MIYHLLSMDFYETASKVGAKMLPWHWNNIRQLKCYYQNYMQ